MEKSQGRKSDLKQTWSLLLTFRNSLAVPIYSPWCQGWYPFTAPIYGPHLQPPFTAPIYSPHLQPLVPGVVPIYSPHLQPSFTAPIYSPHLQPLMQRSAVRRKFPAQWENKITYSGFGTELLDPESSAMTTRSPHFPLFSYNLHQFHLI